jgi:Cu-Zn family superoxide dismutase
VAAPVALAKPKHKGQKGLTQYVLPGDQVFPEGIDVKGNAFFVSSTTDGTIFRGTRKSPQASVFLPGGADGRTTAVGVRVAGRRLFVAGGGTGSIWVYDTTTGKLLRRFDTGSGGFLNDVAVAGGTAYVTDSQRPHIYRVTKDQVDAGTGDTVSLAPWIDDYPEFQAGAFNANGIVSRGAGQLIYVQSGTGKLWRVDVASKAITNLPTSEPLTNGDGLVRHGRMLYVVRNALNTIATVDLRSGQVTSSFTDAALKFPTTAAEQGNRLLVVNSQFNQRGGTPDLPFTVVAVPRKQL